MAAVAAAAAVGAAASCIQCACGRQCGHILASSLLQHIPAHIPQLQPGINIVRTAAHVHGGVEQDAVSELDAKGAERVGCSTAE
jgi:hypothetical protein